MPDKPFDERCYDLLKQIPKGRVTTYKLMAEALGIKAYRAVGNAMAKNPNLVTVPCHRVVESDGKIGGYAQGRERKIALLESEGIMIENDRIVDLETHLFSFR